MLLLSGFRLRICGISVKIYDKVKCVSFSDGEKKGSKDTKDTPKPRKAKVKKGVKGKIDAIKKKKPVFLTEENLEWKEPLSQFRVWFEEASATPGIREARSMCMTTASKDGTPRGRWMLLKSFSIDGFKFFTSYESRKARDLEENPKASLTFYWEPLERQVVIYGKVEKTSEDESNKYFASRPRDMQIVTWACRQSSTLAGRGDLIKRVNMAAEQFKQQEVIPRPDFWGGYILLPETVEFWQGHTDQLHDIIVFRRIRPHEEPDGSTVHKGEDNWVYERLAPI